MTVTFDPLPMKEAALFWKNKVHLSPGQFAKLENEAKLMAFGVSGIAKGDQLTTVYNALQRAIEKGTSFSKFKKECRVIFERRGWTGKRDWRVQNIFRTNIQTAYNSGQYKRQKEMADTFPYLQYSAIDDRRTRPTHNAVDEMVFPIDHPFWNTWYPPNGYRCRCSTMSLSYSQVKRMGLTVETKDPTDMPIAVPSAQTGALINTQQLLPDAGFEHHPGKVVWGGIVDQTVSKNYMFTPLAGLQGPDAFRRPALRNAKPSKLAELTEDMLLPSGQADDLYIKEFRSRYGDELVLKDAAGEPVILSLRSFQINKKPGAPETWKFKKDGHGEIIPLLQEAIEHPYEIWLTAQKNGAGKVRLSRRYITLWKTEDKKRVGGLFVFEVVDGVFQGVTAYVPKKKKAGEKIPDVEYVERQRKGVLLYPRR